MSRLYIGALSGPRTIPPCFEQYAALLTPIRWRWRKTAGHGRQTPFLNVGLNEDETALAKIDVDCARTVGADCGEEILGLETVGDVVKLFAVAREEKCACSGSIANADDIALYVFRAVVCGGEGLIVATLAGRGVRYRRLVPA